MSPTKSTRRLQYKLLAPLLGTGLLLALVFHFYWLPARLASVRSDFQQAQKEMLAVLKPAMVGLLLSDDIVQVHRMLEQVAQATPHWTVVTLIDAKGQRLYPIVAQAVAPDKRMLNMVSFDEALNYQGTSLGRLQVMADPTDAIQEETDQLLSAERWLLLLLAMTAGLIGWLQSRIVMRPLQQLAAAADRLAENDFSAELPHVSQDEMGHLVRAFGAMRESRRLTETEVQRVGDLLRGSIDALDEAFVLFDPQDRLVLCNDKYREVYSEVAHLMVPGAQFEDLIRASAEIGQYVSAIGRVDEWVAERLAIHLAANTTLIQKHSNGRTLRIIERRLPDGHIVGFRIDITELKQQQDEILRLNAGLEERVQQRTAELQDTLQQQKASGEVLGAISSSIADTKPVFDKILESCQRLFEGNLVGVTLATEDGKVELAAYQGEHREEMARIYPMTLSRESGTGCAILDQKVVHFADVKDGSAPPQVVKGASVLGFNSIVFAPMLFKGHGIGAIWVARRLAGDFTDKQIALLKTFADQAVIAIQNTRLFSEIQEKSRQLEIASQYKSEFLSSMSHELRTPLNSLLILAQLLAENPEHNLSEKQVEYAKTIQGAGKDLLELINDILDLAKIESGTVTLELQDVSFANVSEQLERAFRHVAQSRSLGFGVELAPGLPPSLYTDSQRLQQVMKNLLSNAFKFTQKGQVSVRIAAVESGWSVDHDGLNRAQTVIGLFVTDSGIGLAADKQKIIFEAFQQADTGTAKKYGGTGLGLSISRELAWLLGGELRLAMSAPGQGSTFVLYLPLRAPESGQRREVAPVV